jgi:ribonuclease D
MSDLALTDTPEKLHALIKDLQGQPWLAVDTEFYRERTYRPQLCLMQLCTPDQRVGLVDAIALDDLAPLMELLYAPGTIKVLHAARQDLELLYWMQGSVPTELFDTQLAAEHLGHAKQVGYGNLVRERLEVELDKACTRIDWRKRPLSEEALQYAADDVIYLAKLYPAMRDQLEPEPRAKVQAELEVLTQADTYEPPLDVVWQRIKGSNKLKGSGQALLQALASWRESTARERDIPRGWLIKDGILLALARKAPRNMGELRQIKNLPPRTLQRRGKLLLKIIADNS